MKKLIAEVLVNVTEENSSHFNTIWQIFFFFFEKRSGLIIPVLIETHQCQISLVVAGYLSLTAHGVGLLNSKDTHSISVKLCSLRERMTNWRSRRWSWAPIAVQVMLFPTCCFFLPETLPKKGACNWAVNSHRLFQHTVTCLCHTALRCRVDLFCRACSCCCHFVFNEVPVKSCCLLYLC